MKRVFLCVALLCFLSTPVGSQARIYSWIDQNGTEHYSTTPPPGEKVEQEKIEKIKNGFFELELISWSWDYNHGYAKVHGLVKNISSSAIKNLVAVAIFLDEDGTFIKSDEALIEYRPLLPGQSSPFKILSSWNPAMFTCRLSFKHFFGSQINYKYEK